MLRNMHNHRCAGAVSLGIFVLFSAAAADGAVVRYRAVLLPSLNGGPISEALAINSAGIVTGTAGSSTINPGQHAVLWGEKGVHNLDPMFNISHGQVINDSGAIAGLGLFCPQMNGTCAGVIARALPGGQFTPIGTLGGGNAEVLDMNAQGDFVGWAYDQNATSRAFLFTESGGLQNLNPGVGFVGNGSANAINDAGIVVGSTRNSTFDQRAFAWSNGVLGDLGTLGGASSEAKDINSTGTIVGWAKGPDGMPHAFRTDSNRQLHSLQTLRKAMWSEADLVNDAGMIAGTFYNGTNDRLFVFTEQSGMVELDSPVADFNAMAPRALNDQGQMVGVGITNMYQALPWFWSADAGMRVLDELVVAGDDVDVLSVGGINASGQIAATVALPGTFVQRAARLDPVAPTDINADGAVNVDDLLAVITAWGSADLIADIDGDGVVAVNDLLAVITNWG